MRRHNDRDVYFMVGEAPILGSSLSLDNAPAAPVLDEKRDLKFGRMFKKEPGEDQKPLAEQVKDVEALVELGRAMNTQAAETVEDQNDSNTPSGYTYLGQFIAHEITFDKTRIEEDFPTTTIEDLETIEQGRTPSIDLDSLYGLGPQNKESRDFYQDGVKLKVGTNQPLDGFSWIFRHDLPRSGEADRSGRALIPDPRNDENLAIAQTHLALIKFHNKVVDKLEAEDHTLQGQELFEKARECVVKHFQWMVRHDFLPRIIDEDKLDEAMSGASGLFEDERKMFMPVEFSGAAFRFGHSMVRNAYEWNGIRNSVIFDKAPVSQLFDLTNFTGDMQDPLPNDWIIDWRFFYDFNGITNVPQKPKLNLAKKIDTAFNLRIEGLAHYPHPKVETYRPLTVRNLIRGYALGLPSGQAVADFISKLGRKVRRLEKTDLLTGPHADVIGKFGFEQQTPLWYYILKEAELHGKGNHLGDVGSFIVAETFGAILRNSSISILKDTTWRPTLDAHQPGHFAMVDLLKVADVIDPLGPHLG